VLIELAGRMRAEVREVDTVARYGGEEFVIVLPETDAAGAARLADRLGTVLRASPFCADAGRGLAVTASIGAAVFPEHGATPSRLLRSADEALYVAKNNDRDAWRFADTIVAAGDDDSADLASDDGDGDGDGGHGVDGPTSSEANPPKGGTESAPPSANGHSESRASVAQPASATTILPDVTPQVVVMPDAEPVRPWDLGRPYGSDS
jgi:two-component system, cell cycle response regulator